MKTYYNNINPTAGDNISTGYAIGDLWKNIITYDEYEQISNGVWVWRKSDGVIVGSEAYPTYNLNTGSTGGGVEIVNDLTTGGVTKALSAEQGKLLQNSKMNLLQNGTSYVDTTILHTLVGLGFDLSNANLSNENLHSAYLANANLSNASLAAANLFNANLSNANLAAANLSNANLSNANLAAANLSNADLSNANLYHIYLDAANLSNANLSNANLDGANLANVTGLNSDINTALADVIKDFNGDGQIWTLTWIDDNVYQCNPSTGLFTIQ